MKIYNERNEPSITDYVDYYLVDDVVELTEQYDDKLTQMTLKLEELYSQIEQMKCCENCKYDFKPNSSANEKCCICTIKNYLWENKYGN